MELMDVRLSKFTFGGRHGFTISLTYGDKDKKMNKSYQVNMALRVGCPLRNVISCFQDIVTRLYAHGLDNEKTYKQE